MKSTISKIMMLATACNGADPAQTDHLFRVYTYAHLIADCEECGAHIQFLAEAAAVLHDIGMQEAVRKHGTETYLQYLPAESAAIARMILEMLELPAEDIDRICLLIAGHHNRAVDGLDFQILLEADFIVNALDVPFSHTEIQQFFEHTARTRTGKELLRILYLPELPPEE